MLPLKDQVERVMQEWQSPLPRLLIFDNCEDEALLDTWRPKTGGCRVLATSRRAHWDVSLGVITLALDTLPRARSVELLRKFRLDLPADDPNLDAIADELGDLPLALHLAGNYLAHYRHAVTSAAYLAQVRDPTLLQHRSLPESTWSLADRPRSGCRRTFALGYERLDPADPTDALAVQLLSRAAYFAPGEPIPRDLLAATVEDADEDADGDVMLRCEDAIARLVALGLLDSEASGALRLHRLLGVFVRALSDDDAAQVAVEQAMERAAAQLNTAGYPPPLVAIQTHLRMITDRACTRVDALAELLCNQFGYHLIYAR